MKKYLKIIIKLFQFSQLNYLEYRADFYLTWIGDILAGFFAVILFEVIYLKTSAIATWSQGEVYLIIAVANFLEALIYFIYSDGLSSLLRLLPQGDLDHAFLKPLDSQFYLTFSQISPNALGPIVPAVMLTIAGLGLIKPEH